MEHETCVICTPNPKARYLGIAREDRTDIACSQVEVTDAQGNVVATVVYSPDEPHESGATTWVEVAPGFNVRRADQMRPIVQSAPLTGPF